MSKKAKWRPTTLAEFQDSILPLPPVEKTPPTEDKNKVSIETPEGFWNAEKRKRGVHTVWTIYHPSGSYEFSGSRSEVIRDMKATIKNFADREEKQEQNQ